MSGLIVSEFVTLNGVMEAPGGEATHPHSNHYAYIADVRAYDSGVALIFYTPARD